MIFNYDIDLTTTQGGFLSDPSPLAIYRGGLGAGKTRVINLWGWGRAEQGRRVILTEPTYQMVDDVMIDDFEELFEEHKVRNKLNKSKRVFTLLDSGGRIYMRSGEKPNSMRGINADDFGMDEASYQKHQVYIVGTGRTNRRKNKGFVGGQKRIVGTPKGRDWVYDLGNTGMAKIYTQSTFANPFLSDEYKIDMIQSLTSQYARQELYGDIVDFSAGLIRSSWFERSDYYPVLPRSCRSWDLAFTQKKSSDFTASSLMTLDADKIYLHDVFRMKKDWPSVRAMIIDTAQDDGPQVPIVLESVGAQAALVDDLKRDPDLRGFKIKKYQPIGDKVNRAMGWAAKAERGKVFLLPGARKDYFLNECDQFSADDSHAHDDIVDSISQGYNFLNKKALGGSGNIKGV